MDRRELDGRLKEILDAVRKRIVEGASPSLGSLGQMENLICQELNASKAQTLQAWCDQAKDDSDKPVCPHCGGKMRHKGHRKRTLACDGGQVELSRARWWCDACKASFSPSGRDCHGGGVSGDAKGWDACG